MNKHILTIEWGAIDLIDNDEIRLYLPNDGTDSSDGSEAFPLRPSCKELPMLEEWDRVPTLVPVRSEAIRSFGRVLLEHVEGIVFDIIRSAYVDAVESSLQIADVSQRLLELLETWLEGRARGDVDDVRRVVVQKPLGNREDALQLAGRGWAEEEVLLANSRHSRRFVSHTMTELLLCDVRQQMFLRIVQRQTQA